MKILLINPSLIEASIGHYKKSTEKQRGIYPSLGLGYIAAVLEKEGHKVRILDYDTEKHPLEKIIALANQFQPELIGFYAMTWNFREANALANKIKTLFPQVKFVVGGPNITCLPYQSMTESIFDFGVISEGESTIIELIEALNKNVSNFKNIKGLVYKKDKEIIVNQPRPLIESLNSIPFPARHLLPIKKYFDISTQKKHFATIIATRGCPFECTFCDRKNRMGRNWRVRSPENIVKEIKQIKEEYGIQEFMFFDDNLIVNKEWIRQLCLTIINQKLDIAWECRARVDMVNKFLLELMKKAGCYRIRFGFESGNNHILKVLKKGINVEQSLECAKICQEVGMEMFGYFMLGSPYETEKTLQQTLDLALKIDPDFALFSKTILIPGSELFDWAVENNYVRKDYWERYLIGQETNGAPALDTKELPEKTVDKYISLANKKFYLRPKYLLRRLTAIRNWQQLSNQLKMAKGLLFKS